MRRLSRWTKRCKHHFPRPWCDLNSWYNSEEKDLKVLSDLGHFLKGSSAALGVERVQASCERIQHAGKLRDEVLGTRLTEPQALELITELLEKVKCDYPEAREELDRFFETQ
jgi:HPt (histidine-containing phosphotransfer) domain-containing protein